MTASLSGQTALITGATSGIGRAIAIKLAAEGAHALVSGRDADRAERVLETIRAAGGSASYLEADLTTSDGPQRLADEAWSTTGQVDILVNNAGVFPFMSTSETTPEALDQIFRVNVSAPILLVGALAPRMIARGGGTVVNVGTAVAHKGVPGATAYLASKAAVHQLSRIWVAEFAGQGVRVNTVVPGFITTEGTQASMTEESRDAMVAISPAGRGGTPEEVASAVSFLVSSDAAHVHGAFLTVDGGGSVV